MIRLTDYVDVIFSIARKQDVDVGVGRDMFLKNIDLGYEKYTSDTNTRAVNYSVLKNEFEVMSDDDQLNEINRYEEITDKMYDELCNMNNTGKFTEMVELLK